MDFNQNHILLVEDEKAHAELIQRAFERRGDLGRLTTVNTLAKARDFLAKTVPHLVITDVTLPDGKGTELLPEDANKSPYPVVVMTSPADKHIAAEAMKMGAADYILKSKANLNDMPHCAERTLRNWNNIVRRKRARERLLENEQRLKVLFEFAPDATFLVDLKGNFVDGNRVAERLAGFAREELVGKNFLKINLLSANQIPKAISNLKKNAAGKPTGPDEFTLKRKDGSYVTLEIRTFPVKIRNRSLVLGIARNVTERKKAEDALAEERSLLRTLIDNLPDFIYVKDTNSRFVVCNAAVAQFMGVKTPDELTGKTDFDFRPKQAAEYYADEQQVIRSQEPLINKVEPASDQKGNMQCILTTKVPLRDSHGNIVGIVGIGRNITDRKKAEDALTKERNLLRTVIDNIPDEVYVKDTQSRFLICNKTAVRGMGAETEDDILGKTDYDFYPPKNAEEYRADEQQVIRSGKPMINKEEFATDRNGNLVWFVISTKTPLRDSSGEIIGIVGTGRDITDRKKAENALTGERNLLRTLIDNIPDEIYVKDTQSRFLICNKAVVRGMGAETEDDILGKTDYEFYPPKNAEEYRADEQQIIRSGKPIINKEESATDHNGNLVWFVITTKTPLRDSSGEITGIVGIGRNITDRKKAENALAEERNLLRTLIDNMPDEIYVKDTKSRFLICNKAVMRGMGVETEDDILGKTDYDFYPPKNAEEYRADEQQVIRSGKPMINKEDSVIGRDGNQVWFITTMTPLQDSSGEITGIVGIGRNITDRKKTENALAEERNLLRTLIDNIPDEIYVKDTQSRFLICNKTAMGGMGVETEDDILGKTDYDFCPLKRAEEYHADEQRIIRSGKPMINKEESAIGRDGNQVWFITTKAPLRDSSGEITGIVGIGRNITERKHAQEQLKQSREFLANVINAIDDAIFVKDDRHRWVVLNDAACKRMGHPREELIGKSDYDLFPKKQADIFWKRDTLVLESGGTDVNEEQITWHGKLHTVSTKKYVFTDAITGSKFIAGTVTDITRQKNAEKQIRQYSEQLEELIKKRTARIQELERQRAETEKLAATGRMAARIAHEINNPLGGVKNSFLLIKDAIPQDHPYYEYVGRIETEIERIARIVRQMFNLHRPYRESARRFSVEDCIRDVVALLETSPDEDNACFQINVSGNSHIYMPEGLLRQLLFNLIQNAIEASEPAGTVKIDAAASENQVTMEITNQGNEIPYELRDQIFEPFFTTKTESTTSGLGLGLSICKSIVDAMGGTLTFESEKDKGTVFRISIPINKKNVEVENA